MTTSQKNQQRTKDLESQLTKASAQLSTSHLKEGLLLFFTSASAFLFLLFLIDFLTHIPYVVRLIFWLGALGYGVYWFIQNPLKRSKEKLDAEAASLWVEKENPELRSRLISTLQFNKIDQNTTKMSTELIKGTIEQAFSQLGSIVIGNAFKRKLPKNWFIGLAVCFVFWALSLILSAERVSVFAQRLILPNVKYPTYTQITDVQWPKPFVEKQAFNINVNCTGTLPSAGIIEIEGHTGESLELELLPIEGKEGQYQVTCTGITGVSELSVRLGDDRFGPVELTPLTRPQLLSCELTVTPPAYTNKAQVKSASGSARMLMQSQVLWKVHTKGDIESIAIQGENLPEGFKLKKGSKDGEWTSTAKISQSFSYQFQIVDRRGVESLATPQYRISTSKDKAPTISIKQPSSVAELAPRSKLKIEAHFRDDYGLNNIELVYRKITEKKEDFFGTDETKGTVLKTIPAKGTSYQLVGTWDNQEIDCNPGDRIEVWLRASDHAEPEANINDSKPFQITVIDENTYRNSIISRLNDEIEPVNQIVTKLKGNKRKLEELAK